MKMLMPLILARRIKAHERASVLCEGTEITAFAAIAGKTSISKIILVRQAAVLFADDMVYFAAEKHIVLMQQAVFT